MSRARRRAERAQGPARRAPLVARLRAAGCVFAEDEAALLLAAADADRDHGPASLEAMVARRVAGEPLEHVLGWAEFAGLRLSVGPGVFVPRRRSELLVRCAAQRVGDGPRVVVDLCCGCGALGRAVAERVPGVELHAADIDPVALEHARRNLAPVGGQVYRGDLYAALPDRLRAGVDVVVANAPYVPTAAIALMPPEARLHEPVASLDGGADGLDLARRLVAEAPAWLRRGGRVVVETGADQAAALADAAHAAGLVPRVVRSARLDATVLTATAAP